MVSNSSSRTIPFTTYPCAPASSARCMSTSPSWELRTMMRAFGDLSLIFLITSKPLMSGNCKSTRVTSGRSSKNRSSASPPVAAAPADIISGCRLIIASSPSRTTGWSSTHKIRIFLVSFMKLFRPIYPLKNRFPGACPALPHRISAYEFPVFELRNATPVRNEWWNETHPPGRGDSPERTNRLPYLRRRDCGWKYYRLGAPLALSFPLFHSDQDALNLGSPRLCRTHYPEPESVTVRRHSSVEHECCGRSRAEARL